MGYFSAAGTVCELAGLSQLGTVMKGRALVAFLLGLYTFFVRYRRNGHFKLLVIVRREGGVYYISLLSELERCSQGIIAHEAMSTTTDSASRF